MSCPVPKKVRVPVALGVVVLIGIAIALNV